jgi:riboflavin synthase
MFTGIVTDIGRVTAVERGGDTRFEIATSWDTTDLAIGASVAHSGVCLTVTDIRPGRWWVSASAETLARTTLAEWVEGTEVNLERSLRLGDEIGGHLVYGHVDGTGHVVSITPEGDSLRMVFEAPASLGRFLAAKGSICIDGVSLTVNDVEDTASACRFGINIIPHTQQCTTFRNFAAGRRVNYEIDMLARYTARLLEARPTLG